MFRFVLRRRRVWCRRTASAAKRTHYELNKESARAVILARLTELNQHYGFTYATVSIRAQRARWGSCSKKGNLSFNYVITALPPHLMDYVIVHELCHLAEFNHGPRFWALVSRTIPDHKMLRQSLRSYPHLLR